MSSIMRCRSGLMALSVMRDAPVLMEVANPSSQDRTPRRAIVLAVSSAAAPYRASGLVRWHFSDLRYVRCNVRFSNRPFGVKHFQTIHLCGVGVAHGLVLLFGIGTKALPVWDSRTRRNNLLGGLAVSMAAGPSGHTNSPHPSSREGHLSTARWNSSFLLSGLILNGFHAAATTCSRVQRNSVPSTQMRCMITANRRASATIAFFIPRCLAIFMAQALSQDHFAKRTSMI